MHLLDQQLLRTHRVQHLQQHRPQQFLRRNAGTTCLAGVFIHAGEQVFELTQRIVDYRADRPQRMVGRNKIVQLLDAEQALRESIGSTHPSLSREDKNLAQYFSSLLSNHGQ